MVCATQLHRVAQAAAAAGLLELMKDNASDRAILLAKTLEMDVEPYEDCGILVNQLKQQSLCVEHLHSFPSASSISICIRLHPATR